MFFCLFFGPCRGFSIPLRASKIGFATPNRDSQSNRLLVFFLFPDFGHPLFFFFFFSFFSTFHLFFIFFVLDIFQVPIFFFSKNSFPFSILCHLISLHFPISYNFFAHFSFLFHLFFHVSLIFSIIFLFVLLFPFWWPHVPAERRVYRAVLQKAGMAVDSNLSTAPQG